MLFRLGSFIRVMFLICWGGRGATQRVKFISCSDVVNALSSLKAG
jgi:hypothetical protein